MVQTSWTHWSIKLGWVMNVLQCDNRFAINRCFVFLLGQQCDKRRSLPLELYEGTDNAIMDHFTNGMTSGSLSTGKSNLMFIHIILTPLSPTFHLAVALS
eukprot:scaffold109579_cov23-Cyclotella_meneghiniana.AAC.1